MTLTAKLNQAICAPIKPPSIAPWMYYILCTCNFVRIYMHEEGFAEVRVGRAYTRNILMEIYFFKFLSASPPFPCYSRFCMKSS